MNTIRVLLVEDNEQDAELTLRELRKGGYSLSARTVASAVEFEKALSEENWDLVLSDFNVPGFSAMHALHILKENRIGTPFIVISGAIGEESAVELIKAGAEDFIRKANPERLRRSLERCLRERELRGMEQRSRGAAEAAIREREKMLAIVSHDLKNPLGTIKLSTQIIQKLLRSSALSERDDKILKYTTRVEKSVNQMEHLICDILDFAKIKASRFSVSCQYHSIDTLISDLLLSFESIADQKSIQLVEEPVRSGSFGFFDRDRIFQVLSNLVANAIKFSPERGRVTITFSVSPDKFSFSVTDSGPGVPEEALPHIFETFWQVAGMEKEGAGLGLSIAKGIIDAHGGKIGAKTNVGQGSTFFFSVPQPHGNRLLIVEDDEDLLELYQTVLEEEGYQPTLAKSAEEGMKILREISPLPRVLIVDGRLPKMSGKEFVAAVRSESGPVSQIPIVFASAEQDFAVELQTQVSYYLPKPLDFTQLLAAVRSLIPAETTKAKNQNSVNFLDSAML